MQRASRLALQGALVVAGLLLAVFYGLLFAIADCSDACQAAGERAGATVPAAVGFGLAAAGLALARGRRVALGWGLAVAGLVAAAISALLLTDGERGWHVAALVGGAAAAAAGAWALARRGGARGSAA